MALIDYTYFQERLIAIPNLSREEITARLNSYINFKEDEYLSKVLGYEMKTEFEAAIAGTPAQKWIDLRDGAEFSYNGNLYKWTGFLNDLKDSPIAYYVYYWMIKEDNTLLTGTGTAITKNENSDRVTPLIKLVDSYVYMADKNRLLKAFIEANSSDYPSYAPTDYLIQKINYFGI